MKEQMKSVTPAIQDMQIQSTSSGAAYSLPKPSEAIRHISADTPDRYGITRIVSLARDPEWAYVYWEVTPECEQRILGQIGADHYGRSRRILRIHDITDLEFNGSNAHSFLDIEVGPFTASWYLHMPASNRSYVIDIGLLTPNGEFILLVRSNVLHMPRANYSDVLDEQWASSEHSEIFRITGGVSPLSPKGNSGAVIEEISKRMRQEMFMGSSAVSSFGRHIREEAGEGRKFWLVVNTELIVYGATEPDARVTVQSVPIKLNPDGTFSLRFALPDGLHTIPVRAVSDGGDSENTITPIVQKVTA